jgi:uncharacterized protein (DUF697 family)
MPKLPDLASGFKTLREVDLNAIRNQAEQPFHLAVIGDTGVGKSTLINQLLTGPGTREPALIRPVSEHQSTEEFPPESISLAIIMLDAGRTEHPVELRSLEKFRASRVPVIICYNKIDLLDNTQAISNDRLQWSGSEMAAISANDSDSVLQKLVPEMLRIYKGREIVLARHLPRLREPVSRKLIEDTSFINATYSLASGLAGINILLTIPLGAADMIVLTKNQAVMAYKIALAFDLPADWRQTIPKLTTVVSTGFLWRTVARQLVGLIPVAGIIPQVAVAYGGTYAIGEAIYRWCANNEKVNPRMFRDIYSKALERGREIGRSLVALQRRTT